jgi:hypothetical protein
VVRRNVDFVCAVVIVGLLAGVAGLSTIVVLHFVEHVTYNYTFGSLLEGVADSSPVARPLLWLLLVFLVAVLDTHGVRLLVERRSRRR